jgi:hypothetical protein
LLGNPWSKACLPTGRGQIERREINPVRTLLMTLYPLGFQWAFIACYKIRQKINKI